MLIGITGKKYHGKDTVAKIIQSVNGTLIDHMAAPLKRMASEFFPMEWLTDPILKETVYPPMGITPRAFLKWLGTDVFRKQFSETVWIDLFRRTHTGDCIVADIRFDDEAEVMIEKGFVIKVVRPSVESNDDHASEAGINPDLVRFTIINDGTIADLEQKVKAIL